MKRTVFLLALAIGHPTLRVAAQSGTVSGGIVLEAANLKTFLGRIELREKVIVTTEDFVLRADEADFFNGEMDLRVEARGSISVALHPRLATALDFRRMQLQEVQKRLAPSHPDARALLNGIAELEELQRKITACKPGAVSLKVELVQLRPPESRTPFISQLVGAPAALRTFRCSPL